MHHSHRKTKVVVGNTNKLQKLYQKVKISHATVDNNLHSLLLSHTRWSHPFLLWPLQVLFWASDLMEKDLWWFSDTANLPEI